MSRQSKFRALLAVASACSLIPASAAAASQRVPIDQSCTASTSLMVATIGAPSCSVSFKCPNADTDGCQGEAELLANGPGLLSASGDFYVDGQLIGSYNSAPLLVPAPTGVPGLVPGIDSYFPANVHWATGQTATADCRLTGLVALGASVTCRLAGIYYTP
jgi:hypothetical protein